MDKSLGLLAALAAGVGLYFLAENTPAGKKAISNIHQAISNIRTSLVPVVYHGTPPPGVTPKDVCKPGHYLDQTDGILTCVDPHGIRELNPTPKQHIGKLDPHTTITQPDYGVAYGINYIDNDYWGYSGKPDKEGSGWASSELPNMTQPLVQPDINKQIESQIKKGHQKEVKHQKNLDDKRLIREHGNVVATQVECPKDLSKIACGSHCYKDGELMAVDCSGQKNKTKKKPSLTVPANFPNQVTITPGEIPYPETDQEDIGGAAPGGTNTPSLDLNPPNQQQIQPSVPSTSPTPIAPPQKVITTPSGPITAVGHSSGGGCNHKDAWDSCRFAIGSECNGKRSSEDGGQDGVKVSDLIGNSSSFFAIWNFHAPQGFTTNKVNGAEVTAAYCGSNNDYTTVGVTIGVHATGEIKTRTEDHYKPKGGKQRAPGDYMDLNNGVGMKKAPGMSPSVKDFTIIWCADKTGSDVFYRGYLKIGNGKEVQIANIKNPPEGGNVPGGHHDSRTKIIDFTRQQNYYMRGRIDSAGLHATATGTLYKGHYTPGSIGYSYSGPEGYIEEDDYLDV